MLRSLFKTLWRDEAGFVVSSESVLLATLVVLGLISGLSTVREQVVLELADTANSIGRTNQSYSMSAITGHASSTAGSLFDDDRDFCAPQLTDDSPPTIANIRIGSGVGGGATSE